MDFNNSVAVVTGGASGIGLALAHGAVARGAKVVISDIRQEALDAAKAELEAAGGDVLAVKTDVSRYEDVDALAEATIKRFGKANLIFNNAGIFASGLTWEVSLEEYNWVIDVNLKSVVHGIKAFVPRMIAQGDPCHVINTASGAGITVNPGFCTYSMTKHGVVALTEALWLDLTAEGITNIGATVVMPGVVQSKIMFPEKTGPDALQGELKNRLGNKTLNALEAFMRQAVDTGLPAKDLADMVYAAIAARDLYVLPNFNDEGSVGLSTAIAMGRATGKNAYPDIVAGLLDNLKALDA
jgi:NAD(P)-dependent dehydrogenase (short-subunit alcohol dehydrogenase family)